MKRLIIVLLALGFASSLVFAGLDMLDLYKQNQPPRLSLQDACPLALAALGTATNQFYCLNAQALDTGQWQFAFVNTNGVQKYVFVSFDKTTHIWNGPLVYD